MVSSKGSYGTLIGKFYGRLSGSVTLLATAGRYDILVGKNSDIPTGQKRMTFSLYRKEGKYRVRRKGVLHSIKDVVFLENRTVPEGDWKKVLVLKVVDAL